MKKKRVLICGASGFIGKNIFEKLSAREDLEVVGTYLNNTYKRNRDNCKNLVKVDLTDKRQVAEITKGIDIIIQAAAATSGVKDTIERPQVQITENAVMNPLIFESAHSNHVSQVIFFGSVVVYPPNTDRQLKETDANPNSGFSPKYFGVAWTKTYIEKLCEFYAGLGRTKYTVIRHANVYGPYDRFDLERSHVLAALVTKAMTAKNGKLVLWGSGKEEKDLLYISDLVDFVELTMEKQKSGFEIFNAGSGHLISVRDLAQTIITISGRMLSIYYDLSGPTIPTRILLDSNKALRELGWYPKVSLTEGLMKTIDWFAQNIGNKTWE